MNFHFNDLFPPSPLLLQSDLLVVLQQEPSKSVRKKIADLAAELARNLIDEQLNFGWPEYLKFLFDMAQNPNPEMKEVSEAILVTGGVFSSNHRDMINKRVDAVSGSTDERRISSTQSD